MSAQGTPQVPAGWYPDPDQPSRGRFWDGGAWTQLFHNPGEPFPAPPALKAPAGTPWQTTWLWLIVLLPVLIYIPLLLIPWGSLFAFDPRTPSSMVQAELALILSPGYIGTLVLSWLVYGLSVFFAYRDVKELAARGVPKPFHWAFAFISGMVYTIGRSVVVHRRTGRGHAPIWVEVAIFAVGIVVSIVIMVTMIGAMTHPFGGLSGYPV